jgi:hypothetical protein
MILFDPQNELTDKQLDELANQNFDDFLDYLDQKAEYLKQFTKPLEFIPYQTIRFSCSSFATGKQLTKEELKAADEIGKANDTKMQLMKNC